MTAESEGTPPPQRVEMFALTVGEIWREARVSCAHRDLLRALHEGSLDGAAADYLWFHVKEAQCPYCQANLDDLVAEDAQATSEQLDGLRDRLLSSTITFLRKKRERD